MARPGHYFSGWAVFLSRDPDLPSAFAQALKLQLDIDSGVSESPDILSQQ